MVFESNFAPIVGQQVTLTATNAAQAGTRIDLLISRARADECELIARDDRNEGFLFDGVVFQRNFANGVPLGDDDLRARASQKEA